MAKQKVAVQDKKKQVISRRLLKVGLELRDGQVVSVHRTCGQDLVVENKPLL